MHVMSNIVKLTSFLTCSFYFYLLYYVEGASGILDYRSPVSSLDLPGRLYFIGFPSVNDDPTMPKCGDGSPFSFIFKRGTQEFNDHLVVEFMGGQTKSDRLLLTCNVDNPCTNVSGLNVPWQNIDDDTIDEMMSSCHGIPQDLLRPHVPSFINVGNESGSMPLGLRPQAEVGKINITDWNYLYLPYCTKDMFIGQRNTSHAYIDTKPIFHSGGYNVKAVMEWVYTNFPSLESAIFTGCGEGASIAPPLYASQLADKYIAKGNPVKNLYVILDSPMNLLTKRMATNKLGIRGWDIDINSFNPFGTYHDYMLLNEIEKIVKKHKEIRFGIFSNKNDTSNINAYKNMGGRENEYVIEYNNWLSQMKLNHSNFFSIFTDGDSHCKYAFSEASKILLPPKWKPDYNIFIENVTHNYAPSSILSPSSNETPSMKKPTFRPNPVTIALILCAILLFVYVSWFSVAAWRKKHGKRTPTLEHIWLSTLCRYPRIFLLMSLIIPCIFSYLGYRSTGHSIDVNFDFENFLNVDADIAYFADAYVSAKKDQAKTIKSEKNKCAAITSVKARRLFFKGKGERVELYYENKYEGNVFTKEILYEIKDLENSIMNFTGFDKACWQDPNGEGECAPFDSPVRVFFDEEGKLRNIQDVLFYDILRTNNLANVDRYFSKSQLASNFTRSTFYLRKGVTESYIKKLYRELFWPKDQNNTYEHLQFSWNNKILQKAEAFDALRHDLWWSIGTLSFVTVFIYIRLQSIFLLIMALAGLVLSFPVAYFWYYFIYDIEKFSLMNFTALFVMLGIGADDIFLMIDSYRHTKAYLDDTASVEDRMRLAYRKAGSTMLVTSLTASVCFFSNVFNILNIVKEFGLYMGTTIIINYIHVMTILPSAIIVNEIYIAPLWKETLHYFQVRCCSRLCSRSNPEENTLEKRGGTNNAESDSNLRIKDESEALVNDRTDSTCDVTSIDFTPQCSGDMETGSQSNQSSNMSFTINPTKDNQFSDNEETQEQNYGIINQNRMGRIDIWFFSTYAPFVYKWRKHITVFFLVLTLSFGLGGYYKFKRSIGHLVVFKEKYNLGRIARLEYEYSNKNFLYRSEEEGDAWSSKNGIIRPSVPITESPSSFPTSVPTKETVSQSCISVDIPNSKFFENPNIVQGSVGDIIQVLCKDGYSGSDEMVCQENGNWSEIVICTEIIEKEKCPPISILNSNAENIGTNFFVGDMFDLLCQSGYSGQTTMTCLSNLTWSPPDFNCEPKACDPTQILNSDKESTGSVKGTTGQQIFVTCNVGFRGSNYIECLSTGKFTELTCDNNCTFEFTNSKNTLVDATTNEILNIQCLEGFVGGGETKCQVDGNFLPTVRCEEEQKCPYKKIDNSNVTLAGGVGDVINVKCLDGFFGGGLATCTDSYTWDITPTCSGKQCKPIYVENSTIKNVTGTTGDVLVVVCQKGYSGGGTVICKEDGIFDTSNLLRCRQVPKSPEITTVGLTPKRPIQILLEGLIKEDKNVFFQQSIKVFCQIGGIPDSLKEMNSTFFPRFLVSYGQIELTEHKIEPYDQVSFHCYTEREINGVRLQSQTVISKIVEIQILPEEPLSITVTGTGVPRSKKVAITVQNSQISSWNPAIESIQCSGKHADLDSADSKIQPSDGKVQVKMNLSVDLFDVEYFVQCRVKNQFGWSNWVSMSYTLENLDCPKTCLNSGRCNFDTLQCECPYGFTGEQCHLSECPTVESKVCSLHGTCGPHADGPEKGKMCFCDEGFEGIDCSTDIHKYRRKKKSFAVALVLGLKSSRIPSTVWTFGDRGDDKMYRVDHVDVAEPEIQRWLLHIIQKARMDSNLHVNRAYSTWIELLEWSSKTNGQPFPLPKQQFPSALSQIFEKNSVGKVLANQVGTEGNIILGKFTYVSVELLVEVPYIIENSDKAMDDAYRLWKQFIIDINENTPQNVEKITLNSNAFSEVYQKNEILASTTTSWILSYAICFVIILLFTQNISLSIWVIIALILMMICLLGLIFCLYSISFGPIQALGVSIFVGLSSSYVLHVAHAYHDTKTSTRREKVPEAIFAVGSPLVASAISTIGACAFLLGCRIYLFVELGLLLCNNNFIAVLFSLLFFASLLSMVGPRQIEEGSKIHEWDFKAIALCACRHYKHAKNADDTSQSE